MAFLEWQDSFSVKIPSIDKQHQKLIAMINELMDAMKQGKGNAVLSDIIEKLADYTVVHFNTEETYFEKYGYPETEEHKKEHQDFVNKVLDFKQGFEAGKIGLSIEVMSFLKDWLKGHILGTDQKYSDFLVSKGVK